MTQLNPTDFIIVNKRKKYKFALFANLSSCFEFNQWDRSYSPSVIEIGAGTGLFSVEMALSSLGEEFLAVDVKADRLQKGAHQAEAEKLSNLRFLRSRVDLLPEIIKPYSIDKIWITFPDPFPKERSAKRRLTSPYFLDIYAKLLGPNGAVYFKTDARELFDWSLEQLELKGWSIQEKTHDLHDSVLSDDYKITTTYEKRYMSEGKPINFVKATPSRL